MVTPLAGVGPDPALQATLPKMLLGSCSILFVDDDKAFSYSAAKVLRAAGYEVWLAHDYRIALYPGEPPAP